MQLVVSNDSSFREGQDFCIIFRTLSPADAEEGEGAVRLSFHHLSLSFQCHPCVEYDHLGAKCDVHYGSRLGILLEAGISALWHQMPYIKLSHN